MSTIKCADSHHAVKCDVPTAIYTSLIETIHETHYHSQNLFKQMDGLNRSTVSSIRAEQNECSSWIKVVS